MAAEHDRCVLTPECGPHCGLDRGYLGHCQPCHRFEGDPGSGDGMHGAVPAWRKLVADMLGAVPRWMWLPGPDSTTTGRRS